MSTFDPEVGEREHRFTHTVFVLFRFFLEPICPKWNISCDLILFSFKECWRDTKLRTSPWKATWKLTRHVYMCMNTAKGDRVADDSPGSESLPLLVSVLSAKEKFQK